MAVRIMVAASLFALVVGCNQGIDNQLPTIQSFTVEVSERTATLTADVADPDGQLEGAVIDWGDDAQTQVRSGFASISESHGYGQDGTFIVKFTATDNRGGAAFDAKAITILQPSPNVAAVLVTPTPTPTPPVPVATFTTTPTPTMSPTATATITPTSDFGPTITPTITSAIIPTATVTPTPTPTLSPTAIVPLTPTPTFTPTATHTPTPTPTPTSTATPTLTPVQTLGKPPGKITVRPQDNTVLEGDVIRLVARARDELGKAMPAQKVVWTSSDTSVAEVDEAGMVTGKRRGTATITARIQGVTNNATVTVYPPLVQLTVGARHACGLTEEGEAYCWGAGSSGRLGNGAEDDQQGPVAVSGRIVFKSLSAGSAHTCGVSSGGIAYCWGLNEVGRLGNGTLENSAVPVPVGGGLAFASVATSGLHTCGVTTNGKAYCWGRYNEGQLGAGQSIDEAAYACGILRGDHRYCALPVPVSGDITFESIGVGGLHTCGLVTNGQPYCWGRGREGQLGNGKALAKDTPINEQTLAGLNQFTPSAVMVDALGDQRFASLKYGGNHTCGLTDKARVYCWGSDRYGELGVGVLNPKGLPALCDELRGTGVVGEGAQFYCAAPTLVRNPGLGGRSATSLSISPGRASILPDDSVGLRAWDGKVQVPSNKVVWVSSNPGVATVSDEGRVTGVSPGTAIIRANWEKVTEEGTTVLTGSTTITVFRWEAVELGAEHACAVTERSQWYCWGAGGFGRLANGRYVDQFTPVPIWGAWDKTSLRHFSAGFTDSCGVATDGHLYCWGRSGIPSPTPAIADWLIEGVRSYEGETTTGYVCFFPVNINDRAPGQRRILISVGGIGAQANMQQGPAENCRAFREWETYAQKQGFDLYRLMWKDSTDYIQRNAYTLVGLLRQLHEDLGLSEEDEVVVVATSMGGVVSRYGLVYMESFGENHDVDLFVTIDSPHGGAYVPLGVQYLTQYFAEAPLAKSLSPEVSDQTCQSPGGSLILACKVRAAQLDAETRLQREFNSPSPKQLLVAHYLSHHFLEGFTAMASPHRLRDQLLAEFKTLGDHPRAQGLRTVAIAHGRGDGAGGGIVGEGTGPHEDYGILQWEFRYTLFDKIGLKAEVVLQASAYADMRSDCTIFSARPRFLLNGGDVSFQTIAGLAEVAGRGPYLAELDREVKVDSKRCRFQLEVAPGGWSNKTEEAASDLGSFGTTLWLEKRHTFVPTVSALALDLNKFEDLGYLEDAPQSNIYDYTPFDQVYYHQENQSHTEDNNTISHEWIIQELDLLLGIGNESPVESSPC